MFNRLAWDTGFFGFQVARITPSSLDPQQLHAILNQLGHLNVKLVYWSVSQPDEIANRAAQIHNGHLASVRINLRRNIVKTAPARSNPVQEYTGETDNPQLLDLAFWSGRFSRFKKDPHFPPGTFEKLYHIWMNRSITHEMADAVFVFLRKKAIEGMITVRTVKKEGRIGLFSVHEASQGQGIGSALVKAAELFLIQRGIRILNVSTQKDNIQALSFYKRTGFILKTTENDYHFWM